MADAPFAEVIGDPISHSKSPLIHGHWLRKLAMHGSYRPTRVQARHLSSFLCARRGHDDWRGCNVTAPHKQAVIPLLDRIDPAAEAVGAVNCIVREGAALAGYNSDVDGVAAALADVPVDHRRVVLIGAGGGARAALHALLPRYSGEVIILARNAAAAEALRNAAPALVRVAPIADSHAAIAGASLIINATPMGMAHTPAMSAPILTAIGQAAPGAAAFDMVYEPLRTPFLEAAAASGLQTIDGLAMLIGQARRGFELFFGAPPPSDDEELRSLLLMPGLPERTGCG